MKKILFVLAAIFAAITINSCEPTVSGTFSYYVHPKTDDSIGNSSLSWQLNPLGEKLVEEELDKVGRRFSTVWSVSGYKKDCDELVKEAVDAAISRAESDPRYNNILFDLSKTTLIVYCLSDDNGNGEKDDKFEIYRRTYSK